MKPVNDQLRQLCALSGLEDVLCVGIAVENDELLWFGRFFELLLHPARQPVPRADNEELVSP